MKKTVLTDEETRRLIELGVNAEEGTFIFDPDGEYEVGIESGYYIFTLQDLLALLPKKITDRRNIYQLRMGVCDCLGGGECWYIKYVNPFLDTDDLESYGSATELIDAIYEMIIWLKQQDNITEL